LIKDASHLQREISLLAQQLAYGESNIPTLRGNIAADSEKLACLGGKLASPDRKHALSYRMIAEERVALNSRNRIPAT